jgi:hypothetical protein
MSAGNNLTILFLAANPIDTDRLQLDRELRDITEALKLAEFRNRFNLQSAWAVRTEDMRRAMLTYRPQIVHFAGHGEGGGIYVQNNDGTARTVSSSALGNFFANFTTVQCVVLNACYSDELGQAINKSVPYVVGMQAAIEDKAAITFAVAFYDALGAGTSYAEAFRVAISALEMEGMVNAVTPVMLASPSAGPTVAPNQPITPDTIRSLAGQPKQLSRLSGPQFKQFHEALLSAYDPATLAQMTTFELDINLSSVAGGSNLSAVTFNLIDWAQRTGRLNDLIRGALNGAPGNSALQAFVASL